MSLIDLLPIAADRKRRLSKIDKEIRSGKSKRLKELFAEQKRIIKEGVR
jgi:hypothetical protein